jgi:hypothetical protein
MRRYPDWQLRLEAFVRERRNMPFAWGTNDCALFAADAVQALTGEILRPDLRGRDVRDALATLWAEGGVRGIATSVLGEPMSPLLARIGDVVVIEAGRYEEALGICNGGTVLASGADGMAVVSMQQALAAWRVG